MVTLTILVAVLIQFSLGFNEDNYPVLENSDTTSYSYPDDYFDSDNDLELNKRRNNNFLRFGRSGSSTYDDNSDYHEDPRPTRGGRTLRNDYFIRFGRSKQNFLRFGRDQQRNTRGRSSDYLRFGRSIKENKGIRNKREATYAPDELKRAHSDFLRFGRNSNFLRFGRNRENPVVGMDINATNFEKALMQHEQTLNTLKEIYQSPLLNLLAELTKNANQNKCKSSL